jgi:hypothetical protein
MGMGGTEMKDWILELCPEIAEWQAEMIAAGVKQLLAAEREECAKICDAQGRSRKAMEHYAALTYAGASFDCANAIRESGGKTL